MLRFVYQFFLLILLQYSYTANATINFNELLFSNLTPSQHHANLYYDYHYNKLLTYQLNNYGWQLLSEDYVSDSVARNPKVSEDGQQIFVVGGSRNNDDLIVHYQLDSQGVPIANSRAVIWQEDDLSSAIYLSATGVVMVKTPIGSSEAILYQWDGANYQFIDSKDYSPQTFRGHTTKAHPDGSLISYNVMPVIENALQDSRHDTYVSIGENNKFFNDGSLLTLNSDSKGRYFSKISWPVMDEDFNTREIYRTNSSGIDDFEISADGKWLVYDWNTNIYVVEFDDNFNVVNEYHFDINWFNSQFNNNGYWFPKTAIIPPIEQGNFLWINNLKLDFSGGEPSAVEQGIDLLSPLYGGTFVGYGDRVVLERLNQDANLVFDIDERGNAVSRQIFDETYDDTLISGRTGDRIYQNPALQSKIFAQGNPNDFTFEFNFQGQEFDTLKEAHLTKNDGINEEVDVRGFVSDTRLIIAGLPFENSFKVFEFSNVLSRALPVKFKPLKITSRQSPVIDLAPYFNLSKQARVSLQLDIIGSYDFQTIGTFAADNKSVEIDKYIFVTFDNSRPVYLTIEEGPWVMRAPFPLELINVNEAPEVIDFTDKELYALFLVDLFHDPDDVDLDYQLSGLPNGLIFDGYAFDIEESDVADGNYEISALAMDKFGLTAETIFYLTVNSDGVFVSNQARNNTGTSEEGRENSSSGGAMSIWYLVFISVLLLIRIKRNELR